jgi:hypothetical protein
MTDRHEHERDKKEIKGIERPTEEASDESVTLIAIQNFEKLKRFHRRSVVAAAVVSGKQCYVWIVRYLVKAKLKSGKARSLLTSIESGTLGKGSIAGNEYIYNMTEARLIDNEVATWVETCFCDPPLAEERPYWEEYFDLLSVKDAHSRRNCRHENGTEPWACCDCDCTKKLKARLATQGEFFLKNLRSQDRHP